jgi:hypothetical protein
VRIAGAHSFHQRGVTIGDNHFDGQTGHLSEFGSDRFTTADEFLGGGGRRLRHDNGIFGSAEGDRGFSRRFGRGWCFSCNRSFSRSGSFGRSGCGSGGTCCQRHADDHQNDERQIRCGCFFHTLLLVIWNRKNEQDEGTLGTLYSIIIIRSLILKDKRSFLKIL